jgi:hypothetical protein
MIRPWHVVAVISIVAVVVFAVMVVRAFVDGLRGDVRHGRARPRRG